MADLSKLSDSDLDALSKGDLKNLSDEGLQHLDDSATAAKSDSSNQPGLMERIVSKLPSTFGNYTPGATPAQASLDNPEATKKLAITGAALGGGEIVAPLAAGIEGLGGVAARVAGGTAVGDAAHVANNYVDDKPLTEGLGKATLIGAGAGAAAEGVGALAGAYGPSTADSLQSLAHEKALQASGAMKKDFKEIFDKDKLDSLGSVLLAKDANGDSIVPAFSSLKSISSNIDDAHAAAGQEIGSIIKPVSDEMGGVINAKKIAEQIAQDPSIQEIGSTPGMEGVAQKIDAHLNTLAKNGENMTLEQAQKLRQGIDKSINFSKRIPEMAGSQPYLAKMRNAISDEMNNVVNTYDQTVGETMSSDRLRMANQAYSKLTQLKDISDNRMAAMAANRAIGLTDTIAGSGGAAVGAGIGHASGMPGGGAVGAVVGGAVGGGANKVARTFGPSLAANVADYSAGLARNATSLSDLVGESPAVIPASLDNINAIFGSQSNSTFADRKLADDALARRMNKK